MTDDPEEPGTWDFRVRATHLNRERARDLITGNALDDPFGLVTVEEELGPVEPEDR